MEGAAPLTVLACLGIACTFVGLLYIWRGSLPRDHPTTIKRRLFSIALACSVAWLPAYFWATRVHKTSTPVHKLLGLRQEGLLRAALDALLLVATLFAGPLVYFVYAVPLPESHSLPPQRPSAPPQPRVRRGGVAARGAGTDGAGGRGESGGDAAAAAAAAVAAAGGCNAGDGVDGGGIEAAVASSSCRLRRPLAAGGQEDDGARVVADDDDDYDAGGDGRGGEGPERRGVVASVVEWLRAKGSDLLFWRNLVAAPLAEEFVFRACMVPLLMLEGVSVAKVVLLTPLFFGAAHLHHAAELVRHQGVPLGRALLMVAFQMSYTTIFGWLATYLFVRTGHLAAPVAAHVFCNWAGFPPFGVMAEHPRGILLMLTTAAGVAAFFMLLPRLTLPERYRQDFYAL